MSKTRRKIDWSKYEQGLRQRGSITFWFSEDVVDQWHPKTGGKRGGQSHYFNEAAIGVTVLNRMTRLGTPRQFAIVN